MYLESCKASDMDFVFQATLGRILVALLNRALQPTGSERMMQFRCNPEKLKLFFPVPSNPGTVQGPFDSFLTW